MESRDFLDRCGEAFWAAWCDGEANGRWTDLPEHGRARFRALAADFLRRAGLDGDQRGPGETGSQPNACAPQMANATAAIAARAA